MKSERKLKKILLRIFLILAGLLTLYILGVMLVLRFPQFRFPYKLEHRNFRVFSEAEIPLEFTQTLDDVWLRTQRMEIREAGKEHRIFLCTNESTYAFFASLVKLGANSQGFNVEFVSNIFISLPFIERVRKRRDGDFPNTILAGNPAHIIAYEIAHTFISAKLGMFAARKLPVWKREGYAEYTAAKAKYGGMNPLLQKSRQILAPRFLAGNPIRRDYIRGQLFMAWLNDVQKMSFEEVMHSEKAVSEIATELNLWRQKSEE